MGLIGTHYVRALGTALRKARGYWPKHSDRMELRDHTLKLCYWGERHQHGAGVVVDLDYESIKSMPGSGLYELRIDDEIGGQRNIRVIFLDPPASWELREPIPLKPLWVLETFPKRRNSFSVFDIDRFWALRDAAKREFVRT